MANPVQKKDLERLTQMKTLLEQVEALSRSLSPSTRRESGMEILGFTLEGALKVVREREASAHVNIHGTLPVGYKSPCRCE